MFNVYVKVVLMIIFQSAWKANAFKSLCDGNTNNSRSLGISVNSQKSDHGKWTDSFYARAEHSDTLSNISVDVLHNVTECSGRRVIHIRGLIHNGNLNSDQQVSANEVPTIVFHSKHGSNVVVSNNGRTIEKKDLNNGKNGAAFTNRALETGELFEVRLDQKGARGSQSFGIGILTINPEDVDIPSSMDISKYAWMYHNQAIYNENRNKRSNYGPDLNKLPVGTTFGVMKMSSGHIHFFVDGIDHGSAISGISGPVYGVAELWHDAEKVTILKP